MYIALMGTAQQGSSPPLGVSIANNAPPFLEIEAPQGATVQTNTGDADYTATASGGTAPYTFAWAVTELFDDGNHSILSLGTQNAATYDTLTFETVMPSGAKPTANAEYEVTCTVTDSAGAQVTSATSFSVLSIGT